MAGAEGLQVSVLLGQQTLGQAEALIDQQPNRIFTTARSPGPAPNSDASEEAVKGDG